MPFRDIGSDNLPLPEPGPTAQSAHHNHPYHPHWPTSNIAPLVEEDNTPRHHLLNDYSGSGPPQLHVLGAILNEGKSPDPLNMAYLIRRSTIPGAAVNNDDNAPEQMPQDVPLPPGVGAHNDDNAPEEMPQNVPPIPTLPVRPKYRPYRTPPTTTDELMIE